MRVSNSVKLAFTSSASATVPLLKVISGAACEMPMAMPKQMAPMAIPSFFNVSIFIFCTSILF